MSKSSMKLVAVATVGAVVALLFVTYVVSTVNAEVRLRNDIAAKQSDNVSEYDSLWKKIEQAAQVTQAQKRALLEIVTAHAEARGGGARGAVANWIHESVPDVDTTTFDNLQNIITASRDRFAMRQKELLALKSRHDSMLDAFPSGNLLAMLDRDRIDVTVITSTKADEVFGRGKDDEVGLPLGEE